MFLLSTFLGSLYVGIYNVIFNLYILQLGYDEKFLGLLLSVMMITTGLLAFPAAQLCDRLGCKKSLLISSMLASITLYLLYTVTGQIPLLVLSLLSGVFGTIPAVISSPFLAMNSNQDNRIHLFSVNFALFIAAMIIGTSMGGYLPDIIGSVLGVNSSGVEAYRYTLLVSLVLAVASIVPLVFIKDCTNSCPQKPDMKVFIRRLLESGRVKKLVLISCLIGLGAGLIVPFFNVYFNRILSASSGEIGIIFSLAQASMAIGAIFVPLLVKRFGMVKTISFSYLISLPFLVVMAMSTNLYLVGGAYVLRMLFMNMSMPVSSSFSMEIVRREDMASVSSLTSMGNYISVALSTLVAGVMMSYGSYVLPYLTACLLYLIAATLYFKLFRRYEKEKAMTIKT